jgi:alkanesulfonate monooxygenase SsuD/methylene tetrahydromethanopterin reductase-like flavin-dependent oxidoreductase (luciferase family)
MVMAHVGGTPLPRIGFQVWGQFTDWPAMEATVRDIERAGFDSVWSNDHFFPAAGPGAATPEGLAGPFLEGWMTAAGFAMVTSRVVVGVLVSGAGYRNPALVVKMATALDHLSRGRAVLGIGAGWHRRDHEAFGFELPPIRGRLDRLDEQSSAIRGLLDGREVTSSGSWVMLDRARNDPPPVGPLRLMIGGSGERRTLRIVARDADVWNGEGDPDTWSGRNGILDAHCTEIGRDPAAIRRTVGLPPLHLRATREEAKASLAEVMERNGLTPEEARAFAAADPLADSPAAVAAILATYRRAGADEAIIDWPAPFDAVSLDLLRAILGSDR